MPTRLTHDGRSANPVWGPHRIAFSRLPKPLRLYNQMHRRDCFAAGIWTRRPDGSGVRAVIARAPRAFSRFGYYGLQPVSWLPDGNLLIGLRTEWGLETAVLNTRSRRLRRLGLYVDKASRDRRYVLGSGGNDKVTISIMRVHDGRQIFTLRGDICCPDWNR